MLRANAPPIPSLVEVHIKFMQIELLGAVANVIGLPRHLEVDENSKCWSGRHHDRLMRVLTAAVDRFVHPPHLFST